MKPLADPKVDFAFKHVFASEQNKPLLISLLDAVLQPEAGQNIESLELLNPFNDRETLDEKLSILDIKARDQNGRQFNIEMQMLAYGAFRQRALCQQPCAIDRRCPTRRSALQCRGRRGSWLMLVMPLGEIVLAGGMAPA